jgi:magnesium transporter
MSMLKRKIHRNPRPKKVRHSPPGTAPGFINVSDDALKLKLHCYVYDADSLQEFEVQQIDEVKAIVQNNANKVIWFDIKGFGNKTFLEQLSDFFGIHRLQMEDVVNVYQRAKVEEHSGYLFFISRVLHEVEGGYNNDQLSIFLGKNYLITFLEKYDDIFEPIGNRIRHGKGNIRRSGADYLAYSLMDIVIDTYYPIFEKMGDYLDDLQDELLSSHDKKNLNTLIQRKKDLILLRRTIWTEREKMNDILRSSYVEIQDSTKVFFRDSYDHCIQLMDIVESYKEVTASLMDIYQSTVSNRLNQVMKVLTMISTVFIPLTFIVGVYGMNFSRTNPSTGEVLPFNMPELYLPYGYVGVMVVMVLIVIFQIIYFYKKGWLTKGG